MLLRLLLLMTIVPVVELYVLLKVHGALADRYDFATGLLVTVGAILATGALGAWLARSQGVGVLREIQRATAEGRSPGPPLLDGALVLVGAALLLTPGFLTDLAGLSLLVPWTRALYRRGLGRWIRRKIERGEAVVVARGFGPDPHGRAGGPGRGQIIDVTPEDHRDEP